MEEGHARPLLLQCLLIAVLPFMDFAQVGFVAFSAQPIMGTLGAAPEEFASITIAYAVVAIVAIAAQRSLVERLGWRRFLLTAAALSGTGMVVCLLGHDLLSFAAGRMLMAAGCAPSLTAARVLIAERLPAPRRFVGIRFLASGISWGVAAGPLLCAWSINAEDWHRGLILLLAAPVLIACVTLASAPASVPARREFTRREALSLALLAAGAIPFLWALQQAGFDFFDHPAWLVGGALASAVLLGAFMLLQWEHGPRVLVAVRLAADPRLAGGLAIFVLCYLLLGANNLMFPVLLQRGLNVPLATAGLWVGLGSLGGVAAWIALARVLPRRPGSSAYYAIGLAALLACACQLRAMSESSSPHVVLFALALHGAFVITVLSVTAMRSFAHLQADPVALSHGNQIKNMLAQFGLAAGSIGAIVLLQSRTSLHYARLLEGLSVDRGAWDSAVAALRLVLHFDGSSPLPSAYLAQTVANEALFMASLDYFHLLAALAALALCGVAVLTMVAPIKRATAARR
jgi:MFS transporter, DHA2 family, multidrug resistance protein